MNSTIRELAVKAGFFPELNWDHTGWHAAGHNDLFEKFAKLIIQECAKIADIADENKAEWIGGNILTYFGIKEREVPAVSAVDRSLFTGIGSSESFTTDGAKKRFGLQEQEENKELIGYTEREEGYYPMYAPKKNSVVTHAFILCKYCNGSIYHCMGPRHDAVCLKCFDTGSISNHE